MNFLSLLIHLWPGDWKKNLSKLHDKIKKENDTKIRTNLFLIYYIYYCLQSDPDDYLLMFQRNYLIGIVHRRKGNHDR